MANKRIDQYTEKTSIADDDLFLLGDSADLLGTIPKYKKQKGSTLKAEMTTQANAVVSGLAFASFGLFENAIINPIDENMVDQYGNNGSTSLVDDDYAIDRWKVKCNATTPSFTFNVGGDYIGYTSNANQTKNIRLVQIVEDVNYKKLGNNQIIASVPVVANTSNANIVRINLWNGSSWVEGDTHTGGGSEETLTVTTTLSSPTALWVSIGFQGVGGADVSITNTDYFRISKVKGEKGSTRTAYKPRQYEEELGFCQRYYVKYNGFGSDEPIFSTCQVTGSIHRGVIIVPVDFRTGSATITLDGTFKVQGAGTAFTATGLTHNRTLANAVSVTVTGGNITNGYAGMFMLSSGNGIITIDNEL